MTTIYVVTSGSYSDYGIDAIFLDKEKAKKYIAHEKQQGHYTVNDEVDEYETQDDMILPELKLYYKAYVSIRFISEFGRSKKYPMGQGEKYYRFDKINEHEPFYTADNSDRTDDHWKELQQQLTCPSFYAYTIYGISDRSSEVARKIVQDRMAQAIEIVERAGFIPARD